MPSETEEEFIDKRKLDQMKIAILQLEKSNVNTKEFTNPEMVERISQTIINYADKTF